MKRLVPFVVLMAAMGQVEAVEIKDRAVSSSKQFVVYCADSRLRSRVTSFAEEVKTQVLALLGERDAWKTSVTILIDPTLDPSVRPVSLRLLLTPAGACLQLNVRVGEDPAEVNLQKQIVRALLMEISFRELGLPGPDEPYVEAPWWLIDGVVESLRRKDLGINVNLFKGLMAAQKLPSIKDILNLDAEGLGPAAQALEASYAMCLVKMLSEQPSGRANLGRLLRQWPKSHSDPVTAVTSAFPQLANTPSALQKWWSLNVARLAQADHFLGISAEATEAQLAALLKLELVVNKAGSKKVFKVDQFKEFLALPAAKPALLSTQKGLVALSGRANSLYFPIVAQYKEILGALLRGKVEGLEQRLSELEHLRADLTHRLEAIADHLNWYEATQLSTLSGDFQGYLKTVKEISRQEKERRAADPIAQYLDKLEAEF
jgi:hypothetical protein